MRFSLDKKDLYDYLFIRIIVDLFSVDECHFSRGERAAGAC